MLPMSKDKPITFSDQLRDAIRSSEHSVYRIAKLTEIDPALISRFLAGKSGFSMESLDKLAAALGLQITTNQPPKTRRTTKG
jgi:plasmid maintenance system antidote protein VapI